MPKVEGQNAVDVQSLGHSKKGGVNDSNVMHPVATKELESS